MCSSDLANAKVMEGSGADWARLVTSRPGRGFGSKANTCGDKMRFMQRNLYMAVTIAAVSLFASCGESTSPVPKSEISAHRTEWTQRAPAAYEYDYRLTGFFISFAVMTTKDLDIFARAAVLLVIGAGLYGLNVLLTGPRGPFETEELEALKG